MWNKAIMTMIEPDTPTSSSAFHPLRFTENLPVLSASFVGPVEDNNAIWSHCPVASGPSGGEVGFRLRERPYRPVVGSRVYTSFDLLSLAATSAALLITVIFSLVFWDSHQHHESKHCLVYSC